MGQGDRSKEKVEFGTRSRKTQFWKINIFELSAKELVFHSKFINFPTLLSTLRFFRVLNYSKKKFFFVSFWTTKTPSTFLTFLNFLFKYKHYWKFEFLSCHVRYMEHTTILFCEMYIMIRLTRSTNISFVCSTC